MAFNADDILQEFRIFDPPDGSPPLHYLDNAATTQVPDCVLRVMLDHDTRHRSNAKRGIHRLARESTEALEYARSQVAGYLGVKNDQEVVFTSGTTAGIRAASAQGGGAAPVAARLRTCA